MFSNVTSPLRNYPFMLRSGMTVGYYESHMAQTTSVGRT